MVEMGSQLELPATFEKEFPTQIIQWLAASTNMRVSEVLNICRKWALGFGGKDDKTNPNGTDSNYPTTRSLEF